MMSFVFFLLLPLLPLVDAVELVDHCWIEHQYIHLAYTPHFLQYHGAVRTATEHDTGYIDGVKCCEVHLDQNPTIQYVIGLCELSDECMFKHYGTRLKNLTLVTPTVASSSHHYVCRGLHLDESPVYAIFGNPDYISEDDRHWLSDVSEDCDCSLFTAGGKNLVLVIPVSIAVMIVIAFACYLLYMLLT